MYLFPLNMTVQV